MRQIIASMGVLLALTAFGGGGWVAAWPSPAPFLVSDARDIQITARRWNEWQITYDVSGLPTTWVTDVAHQLEALHWSSPDQMGYGSLSRSYSRKVSFGAYELWEWAYLTFDPLRPNQARITVRRWVAIPWWPA